nr:nucleotidyltransferase family protein [Sphingomonas sp. AX6]
MVRKNQARMHRRNGDAPYTSVANAMRYWPETATAMAARIDAAGSIEINAPFGMEDLFALRLKPTLAFATGKLPIFDRRVSDKRWIARYPRLIVSRIA